MTSPSTRPIYIGLGQCGCGRIDSQLYMTPGSNISKYPICMRCLDRLGFKVPRARTASDIKTIEGQFQWVPEEGRLVLGHGHFFEAVIDNNDQLLGWLHTHANAQDPTQTCQSLCAVRPIDKAQVYEVMNADPLTLHPTIKCKTCGVTGKVVDGKWGSCDR